MSEVLIFLFGATATLCVHFYKRAKDAEFRVKQLERVLWMELPEPEHFASWDDLNSE